MKAWHIDRFGGTEAMELREAALPEPGPGEVRIAVKAASINPADAKVRAGTSPGVEKLSFPIVLGRDYSGVVDAAGSGADLSPGEPVFGVLDRGHEGAYSEMLVTRAELAACKPDTLSHAEAAALALTGLTALVALEDVAKLGSGHQILIQGGAGGVGSFAVQYARHVGAEVFATASARNHDYLRALGADTVIDYTVEAFEDAVSDCDVVFDTIGGEVHRRSLSVLKPEGLIVHIAPGPADMGPPPEGIRIVRANVQRDRAHLERIIELVKTGAVRPPAIETLPFADAPRGHAQIDTGHVRGKLVLEIG